MKAIITLTRSLHIANHTHNPLESEIFVTEADAKQTIEFCLKKKNLMDDIHAKALEEKLKSQLSQLEIEHSVFERMVYKNKNQHRRCSYFQYLLKVRRELRLLRTANIEEILRGCFHVIIITGNTSKQKLHVLESLKLKKCNTGKPNILERLRGALHLLSQMTEPILKAASGISTLLARSFFIGFSVTFLALLARLRVLVQQILVDAVSVFNSVTSISLNKQSVKIVQDGVEVFREFYPKDEECVTLLDCVWKTDKYVLLETLQNRESSKLMEENVSEDVTRESLVQYQTFVSSLGEDFSLVVEEDKDGVTATESLISIGKAVSSKTINNELLRNDSENIEDGGFTATESPTPVVEVASSLEANNGSEAEEESTNPLCPVRISTDSVKRSCRATKVAFLPVKRPFSVVTPNTMEEPPRKKQERKDEEGDEFYNLLIRGTQKDSLF